MITSKEIIRFSAIFLVTVLADQITHGIIHGAQQKDSRGYPERIKALRLKKDGKGLEDLIGEIEAAWADKKDRGYFRTVDDLCAALVATNSFHPGNGDRARKLAVGVLDSGMEIPLSVEMSLVKRLFFDEQYFRQQKFGSQEWEIDRLALLRRWLLVWRHLDVARAKIPKVIGEPLISVWPQTSPGQKTYPNMPPEEIKDPVIRKEYEEAIAKNNEIDRLLYEKREIERLEQGFLQAAPRTIKELYHRPPFNSQELENNLDEFQIDPKFKKLIIDDVRKENNEYIRFDDKIKAMQGVSVQKGPLPSGSAVYHSDPRLRLLIFFSKASPKVDDYLATLRDGTGVALGRAENIQNVYPVRGSAAFNGIPAWQIMDLLASYKQVEGRWEKEGDGYRLVSNGKKTEIPEVKREQEKQAEADSRTWLYVFIAGGAILLLILGAITRRRKG